jgi:hypothetical protein
MSADITYLLNERPAKSNTEFIPFSPFFFDLQRSFEGFLSGFIWVRDPSEYGFLLMYVRTSCNTRQLDVSPVLADIYRHYNAQNTLFLRFILRI